MYARAIKGTFTNEVMKKSLLSFLIANFDLQNGMIMAFKLHLSENQVLHVGVFPDKQTADKAGEAAKPVVPTQDNGQRAKVQAHRSVVHGPWATGRGFWISGWLWLLAGLFEIQRIEHNLDQLTPKSTYR